MPTMCLRMPGRHYCAAALLALGIFQCACGTSKVAPGPAAEQAQPVQAGFFTVAADQMAHLKVVTVGTKVWQTTVVTTGTVDWDADHTTQAITQVNGPISRILVDTGAKVKEGDPLLYVSSPDVANAISAYRKARNREAFNKRIVDRMQILLDRGAVAAKDVESTEADYNDARTDVQNSLQALRIFGITQQQIDQAEQQGTAISTELAVRAPIGGRGGAETGFARNAHPGRHHRLLPAERRVHGLGAGATSSIAICPRCASATRWRKPTPPPPALFAAW